MFSSLSLRSAERHRLYSAATRSFARALRLLRCVSSPLQPLHRLRRCAQCSRSDRICALARTHALLTCGRSLIGSLVAVLLCGSQIVSLLLSLRSTPASSSSLLFSLSLSLLSPLSLPVAMDVLECVSISRAEDAPLLERFYNELMIPNFPLKEVRKQEQHSRAKHKHHACASALAPCERRAQCVIVLRCVGTAGVAGAHCSVYTMCVSMRGLSRSWSHWSAGCPPCVRTATTPLRAARAVVISTSWFVSMARIKPARHSLEA